MDHLHENPREGAIPSSTRYHPRFTEAGLLSMPVIRAKMESAIMSLLAVESHSSVSSCSAVCLASTAPITCQSINKQLSNYVEPTLLTRIVFTPSLSKPSSTLPYIPSRCHLTRSQPTPRTIFCRWVTVHVDNPAKSFKSRGSRRVYE